MNPSETITRQPRPDKHDYATLSDESWFVHGGNRADDTTGAIRTPIVMSNRYALPEDPTTIEDPGYQGLVYTRESGANQVGLQTKLARLEHGARATPGPHRPKESHTTSVGSRDESDGPGAWSEPRQAWT